MTCRAGAILKAVLHRNNRAARLLLVALCAGHSDMRTCERKACFAVTRQGEMRRAKFRDIVAFFAAILIWCPNELTLMNVLMATDALCLGDLKQRVLALRGVAIVAFHFGMPTLERIACSSVFL